MTSITCPSCLHSTPVLARSPDEPAVCLRCRAPIPPELLAPDSPATEITGAAPTDTAGVHPVAPYTGTPGGSPGGFVVTLVVGLVGAGILGALAGIIHNYFWLVLVFPAILGLAIGGVVGLGAKIGKYRREEGAAAAGLLAGLLGAFLVHYVGYLLAIQEAPWLGQLGFLGFLDLRCMAGVGIGSIELGYSGTIIYFVIEAVVVVICAAVLALWPVKKPFCAACNAWKEKKQLGLFKIDGPRAVEAITTGRPAAMVAPATVDDKVTVSLFRCPRCGDAGGIEAEVSATRGKGEGAVTMTALMSYPAAASADFEEARRTCEERGYGTK
jgi:MFS family permease